MNLPGNASVNIRKWVVSRGSIRAQHRRAQHAGALTPSSAVNPDIRRAARDQVAAIGEFGLGERVDELASIMVRGRYRPPL